MHLHFRNLTRHPAAAALRPLAILCIAGAASAQVTFSVDYMSPARAVIPATHGDILTPVGGLPAYGPLPPPMIFIPAGVGGLGIATAPMCIGTPPGTPCPIEVDALSYGSDFPLRGGVFIPAHTIEFSVDEFAFGFPGSLLAPNVLSESAAAVADAAADIFGALGLPPGPLPPMPPGANIGLIDGNGLLSGSGAVYPGTGLIEPNPPSPGGPAGVDGDNLDAYDFMEGPAVAMVAYFSLDAAFLDPLRGMPNMGSAAANGFLPGMVLFSAPGGPPAPYAPPPALGLDLLAPGSDDLDALALFENGIPGYQPSPGPYMWGPGAPFDMLLFSVRRGSAVIGAPDSVFGIPICEGDVLIPPVVGGLSPFPGIFIAAENLGLATARSMGIAFSADLDGLDVRWMPVTATGYCFGTAATCPCANGGAPGNGCANSIFAVGGNLSAGGLASVAADSVILTGINMPNSSALYFQGTAQAGVVFGDGLRCVVGGVLRLGVKINAGNTSSYPVAGDPPVSVRGMIPAAGGTRFYQCWYRNAAAAFCPPALFNLTNGLAITWTP